jgi:hypothetical protein
MTPNTRTNLDPTRTDPEPARAADFSAAAPLGPPKLTAARLRQAQSDTLRAPRLRYDPASRLLFTVVDLLYGRRRSLVKFAMLELIARVPYQAWERVTYVMLTHVHRHGALARRVFDRVVESRAQQDNEQWHLFIFDDLIARAGLRRALVRHRVLPQLIAMVYYHLAWLLFVVKPAWSYRLNANFEDHAEHEYMLFVHEHPEFEDQDDPGTFAADYGRYASVADLLRQIGHDERTHKHDSLRAARSPRLPPMPVPEAGGPADRRGGRR